MDPIATSSRRAPAAPPQAPAATVFAHQPGWRKPAPTGTGAAGPASLKSRVLAEVRRAPGSCEDIAQRLGATVWNVRPRCSELETAGRIRDGGARGLSASGRRVIVWQAVER